MQSYNPSEAHKVHTPTHLNAKFGITLYFSEAHKVHTPTHLNAKFGITLYFCTSIYLSPKASSNHKPPDATIPMADKKFPTAFEESPPVGQCSKHIIVVITFGQMSTSAVVDPPQRSNNRDPNSFN
ncbi:Fructose-1,6-bisphosphatase class 1 2 [Striga asiatica]|uniref:Fructose-1,6-bisphosphatase class 1 2 n=1 Tax=Striga asiatica TaxID=4170 RepID=A0A5A7QBF0_STRAF|nr:Fructose-1,6-bisphosphatase class 1 2 [Striga asiatica]